MIGMLMKICSGYVLYYVFVHLYNASNINAYTIPTLRNTYYYYILHTEYRCYRWIFFGMNAAFCIDLMAP